MDGKSSTYVGIKEKDGTIKFGSAQLFKNTMTGTGTQEVDPAYFYVKKSVLTNATVAQAKERSYYEIEGFQEAIKKFQAFDMPDDSNYNLQGVIIVPSRAAFARDVHFNYTGLAYRNRSFVFNFQIYKTTHFDAER